jgi:SAM-dependent methyltransferase
MSGERDGRFVQLQRSYWQDVDERHFRWQTEGPYIAGTESALVAAVDPGAESRLLEIGCGEGANLVHLRRRRPDLRLFAVDFSPSKVAFAASATGASVASADAARLPFRSRAFDAVLVRDLLHHVPDRWAVIAEAIRVLKRGGSITIIEPNGRNAIVAGMALAIAAERGMLASTLERVETELRDAGALEVRSSRDQPFPLSRIVLHYRLGAPSLGANRAVAATLRALERAAAILPRSTWAYFTVRGVAP